MFSSDRESFPRSGHNFASCFFCAERDLCSRHSVIFKLTNTTATPTSKIPRTTSLNSVYVCPSQNDMDTHAEKIPNMATTYSNARPPAVSRQLDRPAYNRVKVNARIVTVQYSTCPASLRSTTPMKTNPARASATNARREFVFESAIRIGTDRSHVENCFTSYAPSRSLRIRWTPRSGCVGPARRGDY